MTRWLALLLLACTSSPAPPPIEPPPVFNTTAAIGLTFMLRSGGTACGAVAVGPQLLATVAHCVPMSFAQYSTKANPDNWLDAVVVQKDGLRDVAVLRTVFQLEGSAKLTPVSRWENVYSVHHGGGRPWHSEVGQVEGEIREGKADWTETSVQISPGASGCGLWSNDGKLSGLASWFRGSSSYFVPAREIDSLLPR